LEINPNIFSLKVFEGMFHWLRKSVFTGVSLEDDDFIVYEHIICGTNKLKILKQKRLFGAKS